MRTIKGFIMAGLIWAAGGVQNLQAQAVAVTASLDTNTVVMNGSTVLRIYAQVVPALQASSERIFSWYLDVLNPEPAVASCAYDAMQKPASDNDPLISSLGFAAGGDRKGIFDTFLNRPGAGTYERVELMAIPVRGIGAGSTRFSVRAGTGVEGLSNDFIVAPLSGSGMSTGGDYQLAYADLQVSSPCSPVRLAVQRDDRGGGRGNMMLVFTPCSGMTHTLEFRSSLEGGTWQPWPGAPHNSGTIAVTNIPAGGFFRLRIDNP